MHEHDGFEEDVESDLEHEFIPLISSEDEEAMHREVVPEALPLLSLRHTVLFPGVGEVLDITQQELGYLVGLSRQRVNMALKRLEAAQWIKVTYGGIRILNLPALRSHTLSLT